MNTEADYLIVLDGSIPFVNKIEEGVLNAGFRTQVEKVDLNSFIEVFEKCDMLIMYFQNFQKVNYFKSFPKEKLVKGKVLLIFETSEFSEVFNRKENEVLFVFDRQPLCWAIGFPLDVLEVVGNLKRYLKIPDGLK